MKNKIIICLCIVSLLFCTLFGSSASAQSINSNDASEVKGSNLLLIPRRTIILQGWQNTGDNLFRGMAFHTNPLYAIPWVENTNKYIYVNGSNTGGFTGSSYMTHYTQRLNCYYSGSEYYRYIGYLTNADSAQNTYEYEGQFGFESFYIRNGVDENSWIIYGRNDVVNPSSNRKQISVKIEFMKNVNGNWSEGSVTKTFYLDQTDRINIRDIYDMAISGGAFNEFNNGVFIRTMLISNRTTSGDIYIYQDVESVGDTIVQYLVPPIFEDAEDSLPPLVNWISNSLGSFFNTVVFSFAGFDISIGTVFIVPLALWLVVIFLKKFAGG